MIASEFGSRPALRRVYSYVAHPQLYSDHYPEHQNTPNGVISIAFSKTSIRSVHTNNDSVRGVVLVKSNIKVKSVTIDFLGRSTCRTFEGTSPRVSSTDLFRHQKMLRRVNMPSDNCPPNRVEYPFEFRFPEVVELAPEALFGPDVRFEDEAGHMLPPSLWWSESTVRNEYILEARFLSEQKHFTMHPKVVQQLRFFPSVPEVGLPSQVSLIPTPPFRVERMARELDSRGGSFRRLSRRFSGSPDTSENRSSSSSLIVLSAPEHYRVGANSTLKISLQTPPASDTSRPSTVYLRGIRAQALARIDYRFSHSSHPSLAYNILRTGESKFDLFNRRYAIPGLPLDSSAATDVEAFEISKLVPPTFKTYNVALSYDVKYDLLFECGGRESEHEVVVRNVRVEPMTRPGGWLGPPPDEAAHGERDMLAGVIREGGGRAADGAEPPAYEP